MTTLEIVKPSQDAPVAIEKDSVRMKALNTFLMEYEGFDSSDVSDCEPSYTDNLFRVAGRKYYVLTDEEADEIAKDYILDSIWCFNSDFITSFLKHDVDLHADEIQDMQTALYERANSILLALIKDPEDFWKSAVAADGRGHFVCNYDGEEHQQGELFIYRYE